MTAEKLSQFVKVFREGEEDLFALVDDDARETYSACLLDGDEFFACVAVFEELLERKHTCGNVNRGILDTCL